MDRMNTCQHLGINQIKSAEPGHVPGRRAFRLRCVMPCRMRMGMYGLAMPMQTGMRQRMGQCAMLRDQQQPRQGRQHAARAQCASQQCGNTHGLFADGHGIGQPVIQAHRIITQDCEATGHDDGFKTVFQRIFGLHLDHLLRAAGHAE